MNDPQIHRLLSGIESKSKDEFVMLEECGAEYFSTHDLLEMRGKWKEQMRMFDILRKANIYIGASSPIWLILAGVCGMLGMSRGILVCIVLFPLTMFIFIVGAVFLRQTYRSKGWLDFVGRELGEELTKRKNANQEKQR